MTQSTVGFVATLAAMALYAAVHSLLASQAAKRWSRRTFGALSDRLYRLVFNLLGALTFLPVLAVPFLLPGRLLYSVGPPWQWLLFSIQLGAVLLLAVALRQTGLLQFLGLSQLLDAPQSDGDIVTDGVYSWVRHPLYTAGLAFIWAVPRMTTSLLALNLGITAYLYVGSLFEERRLLSEFGEAYARYQQRVPRFFPRPWRPRPATPRDQGG